MASSEHTPRSLPAPNASAAVDGGLDWARWSRLIERRRRGVVWPRRWPGWLHREATRASFCLERIDVSDADLAVALSGRRLRTPLSRRLRAHLAISFRLDRCRRVAVRPVSAEAVVGWYVSIASGLSTTALSPPGHRRLAGVVRQINGARHRLRPAVQDAAALHERLLNDPLFPAFNGILSRLLLQAHLAASGLPPVVLDPQHDLWPRPTTGGIAACLLERMDQTLTRLGPRPLRRPG